MHDYFVYAKITLLGLLVVTMSDSYAWPLRCRPLAAKGKLYVASQALGLHTDGDETGRRPRRGSGEPELRIHECECEYGLCFTFSMHNLFKLSFLLLPARF